MGTAGGGTGRRRRTLASAIALSAALFLSTGCQAYRSCYTSFPLNSLQMVVLAAPDGWSYRKALSVEIVAHVFPYFWVLTAFDLLFLPLTLLHDLTIVASGGGEGLGFDEQVEAEQKTHGPRPHRRAPRGDLSGPGPAPHSAFDR